MTVRNTETAELAAYVEMTKAIFAAAADLIVIVDRDLIISRNSPRGQSFFGYDDDVAMGASVFQLMHPDDRPDVERTLKKMFEENSHEIVSLRYRAQHADGHWMVVESRGHALGVGGGPAAEAVFIARDLTDINCRRGAAWPRVVRRRAQSSTPPSTRSSSSTETSRSSKRVPARRASTACPPKTASGEK